MSYETWKAARRRARSSVELQFRKNKARKNNRKEIEEVVAQQCVPEQQTTNKN